MVDFIVLGVVALLVAAAACYIRREKKRGTKCIGCPMSGSCSGHCSETHK